MFKRLTTLALPIACLTLAACDDSTSPESSLTAQEAASLALALDNASSSSVDAAQSGEGNASLSPSGKPALAVTTRTDEFDFSLPCPRGGTTALDGQSVFVMDTDQGFITLDVSASKGHTACAFRTDQGVDVTVDGTIEFVAEREIREGLIAASNAHSGTLDFVTSDGKEGSCEIDFTTAFSLTTGSATRDIAGSVCGHSVDFSTTWTHAE